MIVIIPLQTISMTLTMIFLPPHTGKKLTHVVYLIYVVLVDWQMLAKRQDILSRGSVNVKMSAFRNDRDYPVALNFKALNYYIYISFYCYRQKREVAIIMFCLNNMKPILDIKSFPYGP